MSATPEYHAALLERIDAISFRFSMGDAISRADINFLIDMAQYAKIQSPCLLTDPENRSASGDSISTADQHGLRG
mgnify:CR=1 FL=1